MATSSATRSGTTSRLAISKDGYKAHGDSGHFQEYGFGQAIPLLESREREFYVTLDS
jgi:hypothetical protein